MPLYILDTDSLSLYERDYSPLVQRVRAVERSSRAVAIISVEEQMSGRQAQLRRARTDAELAIAYQRFTNTVRALIKLNILSFTEPAIARYTQLRAANLNIGKMDLRIAAIALENSATVVTRNLRDFQRVPGLACENWAD